MENQQMKLRVLNKEMDQLMQRFCMIHRQTLASFTPSAIPTVRLFTLPGGAIANRMRWNEHINNTIQ